MELKLDSDQQQSIKRTARYSGMTVEEYLLGLHIRSQNHQISGRKGLALLRAVNLALSALRPLIEEINDDDCPELTAAIRDLQTAILPFRRSRRRKQ